MGKKEREKARHRNTQHSRRSIETDPQEVELITALLPQIEEDVLANVRANLDKVKLHAILESLRIKGEDYSSRPTVCGLFVQMIAYLYFDKDASHKDVLAEDISNGMRTAAGIIRAVGRELRGVLDVYFEDANDDRTSAFFRNIVKDAAAVYASDPTGFSLMDYVVDKMKSPEWLSAQSQLDGQFIVGQFFIAGAEIARKVYREVYPFTESLPTN